MFSLLNGIPELYLTVRWPLQQFWSLPIETEIGQKEQEFPQFWHNLCHGRFFGKLRKDAAKECVQNFRVKNDAMHITEIGLISSAIFGKIAPVPLRFFPDLT